VAKGELIANVDADSILTPGWVDAVLLEFVRNKKLVALSGPFIYYDLPLLRNLFVRAYYYLAYVSYLLNRHILRIGSMLHGGNFVVRREALKTVGGFDLHCTFYGEDTDMARRLHPLGPVKFTFNLPMYSSGRRLQHEGTLTMAMKYSINYLWMIFFKRNFTEHYVDIRTNTSGTFKTNVRQVTRSIIALQAAFSIVILMLAAFFTYANLHGSPALALSPAHLKEQKTILLQKAQHMLRQAKDEVREP
jgi:cellulose synthase/poly-beta-1,6-N-acetylglucosamine synthase-like glycosyltransferase